MQNELLAGQRKSMSPQGKRSNVLGNQGSPVNPILAGAAGLQAQAKKGAASGQPPVAADLLPVKQSSSGGSGKSTSKDAKSGD